MPAAANAAVTVEVSGSGRLDLDLTIERFVDGGALWISARPSGSLNVSDMRWTVAAPGTCGRRRRHLHPQPRRRPRSCPAPPWTRRRDGRHRRVCVVDQGTDQVQTRARRS